MANNTVQEASRLVVPIGAVYTPLKEKSDTPLLQYEPVTCKAPCKAVLNPYAYVSFRYHNQAGSGTLTVDVVMSMSELGSGSAHSV